MLATHYEYKVTSCDTLLIDTYTATHANFYIPVLYLKILTKTIHSNNGTSKFVTVKLKCSLLLNLSSAHTATVCPVNIIAN